MDQIKLRILKLKFKDTKDIDSGSFCFFLGLFFKNLYALNTFENF